MFKLMINYTGRTGSNLLCSLLTCHPDLTCAWEILTQSEVKNIKEKSFGSFLDSFDESIFKLSYQEVQHALKSGLPFEDLGVSVFDRKIKRIQMRRKNTLKQFVSEQIAIKTNVWCIAEDNENKNKPKSNLTINLDVDMLVKNLDRLSTDYLKCGELFDKDTPQMCIWYEELAEGFQKEADRVFDFLGLRCVPVDTKTKRQEFRGLEDIIKNFNEVKTALKGTAYEWQIINKN